ncbi:hypothetical protein B4135_3167 [Caldibacillus debilis]|uniref:Uncharacterized protein n=1 Tax=Caldibacillus debilis TaxID=301148 RepID=A0A150LH64_9BACI|nr:hypothetical protein B4135_3167 [Caldibacillus debilis]
MKLFRKKADKRSKHDRDRKDAGAPYGPLCFFHFPGAVLLFRHADR